MEEYVQHCQLLKKGLKILILGGSMMKVLRKAEVETALSKLAELANVYVPMQRGPVTGFFPWKTFNEDFDDLMLDILNVYQPPKHILKPPQQKTIQLEKDEPKPESKIIFGIRSCDVQGLRFQDEIFLTNAYTDNDYKSAREKTTIIANACYHPGPSCFCTSMGGNPVDPGSADVIIHDAGSSGYVWESKNEKGQILTEQIANLLEEKEIDVPELLTFSQTVDYTGIVEKLKNMFDHPLWEKYAEPCVSCGLCTYACPTCACSDSQLKHWQEEGYHFQCYDSCTYRTDILTNSKEDHRQSAIERFRNRLLHKLQFYPERYGKPLCSGCGRCFVVCPAGYGINRMITEVMAAE